MITHRKIVFLAAVTAFALSCSLAGAGELVRFQDGRYLEVEGHQVHGDAVKLFLANRSVMVLPLERVDFIRSGRVVLYAASENRIASPADLQAVVGTERRRYPENVTRKRGRS